MTKMGLLYHEQVIKCKRRKIICIHIISVYTPVLHTYTRTHAHMYVYNFYMQIVLVIAKAVNSEMSLNLVMCVG